MLELSSNKKGHGNLKIVDDRSFLSSDMTLTGVQGTLVAYYGTKITKMKLK
jgi:hypothetical protein